MAKRTTTILDLLQSGCSITFPSGYILIGDPDKGYIDTAYTLGGFEQNRHADGLRSLDEEGLRLALNDEKYFAEKNNR